MKLYVGNLSFETTDTDLQQAFERFGMVTEAVVIADRDTARSRGFGFVTMGSKMDGEAAIRGLHEGQLQGRSLTVAEARLREDRPRRAFAGASRE